ncbi:MAG: hypothetical protein P8X95_11690 [Anaerolineales bacterium]
MLRRRIEWAVVLCALTVILLTTVPYLYAARSAGDQYVFGGFLFNPIDGNTYLAKMYQGWAGMWLYTMPYSPEAGRGAYLFLFYLFLGHLARITGLSLILTFHIARFLGILAMLSAIYLFYRKLLLENHLYRWAFAFAVLGSGLGWIGVLFGAFTSDLWVAEAYPFLSAFANPHFCFGLALLLSLLIPIRGEKIGIKRGSLILIGSLALAILSPFGVLIALVILSGCSIWQTWIDTGGARAWKGFVLPVVARKAILVFLAGAPILFYYLWVTSTDPSFAIWNAQNLTPSPPVWDFLMSFSPLIILALPGGWYLLRKGTREQRLILVWAVLGVILLYAPLGLQRRFMMGMFVPIAGLAVLGLNSLVERYKFRSVPAAVVLALFILPTNLMILLTSFYGIQTHDALIYLSRGEEEALNWIAANTAPDALVLASPEMGLFIPAHTGRRVFYGHPFETINADVNEKQVEQYFKDGKRGEDLGVLKRADYVFFGKRESMLGENQNAMNLAAVYKNREVVIYQNNHEVGKPALEP